MRTARVSEDIADPADPASKIVVFRGYGPFFGDLVGERDFLKQELLRITNERDKKESEAFPDYDIGINVRLGRDFPHRTPVSWYAGVLQRLQELRPGLRSIVITDGMADELQPLLSLPGVELLQKRSAILDMLILGRARLIIGAGGSSFTAWGSFLSGAPTIILKGLPMDYMGLYNTPAGPVKIEVATPGDITESSIPGWTHR